jgi:hydroxymethylbilane synthase
MTPAPPQNRKPRIGTRGSKLARWQADWVAVQLRALGHDPEILEVVTSGDADQIVPVQALGAPGAFTKEIQRALLAGEVDLAVHSLKDLPTEPVAGLVIAAVPKREHPSDVLVVRGDTSSQDAVLGSLLTAPCPLLPHGARVGTGSLRRQAQLRHIRPDLAISDVRGNVDTRLKKLDEGQFDAIVLAEAGLRRLSLAHRITETLPCTVMLPAVGQGALAIECRAGDAGARALVAPLDDAVTRAAVVAERALLAHLRGGCLAPVGAWGRIENGQLRLSAVVLSADGTQRLSAESSGPPADAEALGRTVAGALVDQGAAALIASSRES